MNRTKRKECLKVLNSGWSALVISGELSILFNQPSEDLLRIINNLHWDRNQILTSFDNFPEAKTNLRYTNFGTEQIKEVQK